MDITSAEFVMSNTDYTKCPAPNLPEYAFIGRSNVGKSSLINALTNRKSLAKTSGKPGKTQLINHFSINKNWYLVDLPGYGYASVSKKQRQEFQQFIRQYLGRRENLICTFVLLDARHTPQKVDLEFMRWMGENGLPFVMVFTKIDKITSSILNKNMKKYSSKMLEQWENLPQTFHTSSETRFGCDEILRFIEKTNEQYREKTK